MTNPFQFTDKLRHYVTRSAYTSGQLANLADLPRTTIVNWLNGRVQRPRDWQPLVRLLTALHLQETEANQILQAANHPTIAELRLLAKEQDQSLLTAWERPSSLPLKPNHPPFQAIADLPYFVGRQTILAELQNQLLNPDKTAISILQGMAGTGKTAVAARIAYQLRPHFPDGVLWARLDISDTLTILHTFARAYGADVSQYDDIASRSRIVRDLLANRRALIVLDNALTSAQVEPLLPPTGQCAVLITTRRQDLRLAQGGSRLTLQPFQADSAASQQLFSHFLGQERANQDAQPLAEIAAHVGHLPLALAIAAGRLAYEPGWSAPDFLARLKQASRRLNEMQSEDQNVRASFAASYSLAPENIQSFFATLSFFGGKDFSPAAAAAADQIALEDAQDYLRMLFSLSLVQSDQNGRYQLHPLLRDYAREQLPANATWTPLANYFIDFLTQHNLGDSAIALESDNVLAVITGALENDETAVAVELIIKIAPFLKMQGIFAETQLRLEEALELAGESQRLPLLLQLSQTARYYRRYDDADAYLAAAETLAQARQDIASLSTIEAEKGIISSCRGDHNQANSHFIAGLTLARQHNKPGLLVSLLKELGASEVALGEYDLAESHYQEALTLAPQSSPAYVPKLLRCLGGIAITRDQDFAHAGTLYTDGLDKARIMNNQEDIIYLLNNLAVVAYQQGRNSEATALLEEGLTQASSLVHKVATGFLTTNLGRITAHEGQWELAQQYFEEALAIATAVNHHEMITALHLCQGLLAIRQQKFQQAETHLQNAINHARQNGYGYGLYQTIAAWGWLDKQQQAANKPSRYPQIFQELAQSYQFSRPPDEYGTPPDIAYLERPKIIYD